MTERSENPGSPRTLTNDAGAPVASNEHSLTAGPDGPILMQDVFLIEKLANFARERVPERVVHAKGGGAFGTLTVTGDVSAYTKAALFQPGATTELLARFSSVAGEQGSPDLWRDVRGFALKFYTSEGNYDLVGNNTPVFFIRDPMKFPDFIHSQKRDPRTGLRSNDMQWDFWTLSPESAHQVAYLMGDRGLPASWRQMNGYGSHTYLWDNAAGERFWVKYHFLSDQGTDFLPQERADELAGTHADYYRADLFDAIEGGDFPSWTLKVQVMPYEDARTYHLNPFDLTKVWPHADYPLVEVGTMRLDRNPENFFTDIEQAAFAPSNFVPGIGPSPDKMLIGRLFSYQDTQRHRIGVNYQQLPVNRPKVEPHTYHQDGAMRYDRTHGAPYAPNSYDAPVPDPAHAADTANAWAGDGEPIREAYALRADDDDWSQPHHLVRDVYDDAARDRLVATVSGALLDGVSEPVAARAFEYWKNIDAETGARIEAVVRGARARADGRAAAVQA